MPDDPEFRPALVGYLEWGSRLAVLNSQAGAEVNPDAPTPKWGWGEVQSRAAINCANFCVAAALADSIFMVCLLNVHESSKPFVLEVALQCPIR
jgi:hypothetical protein